MRLAERVEVTKVGELGVRDLGHELVARGAPRELGEGWSEAGGVTSNHRGDLAVDLLSEPSLHGGQLRASNPGGADETHSDRFLQRCHDRRRGDPCRSLRDSIRTHLNRVFP